MPPTSQISSNHNYKPNMSGSMFDMVYKLVVIVLLVLISIGVWMTLNPTNILNNLNVVGIVNDATKKATESGNSVPSNEVPTIAQINDKKYLTDINTLRSANKINETVYKDAQNGDYVLLYSSKMLIYRESTKTIIYNGETPQQILNTSQQAVVALTVKKAKGKGLLPQDNSEVPQVSVVQDVDALKKLDAFYALVMKDDLIVTFTNPKLVIIYRPSTDEIVKSGGYELTIK